MRGRPEGPDHARVWARHQAITDAGHLAAAQLLRRGRIDLVHAAPPGSEHQVQVRDLSTHDTLLGLDPIETAAVEGRVD